MKPYLTHAVIGDGKMLGTLSAKGELERLFWPTIEYAQQIKRFWTGLRVGNEPLTWLHETKQTTQTYLGETSILKTDYVLPGIRVEQIDFVAPGSSVIVRHVKVTRDESESECNASGSIRLYALTDLQLDEQQNANAVRFDKRVMAMIHYRRDVAAAVVGSSNLHGYQAGQVDYALQWEHLLGAADSLGSDSALVFDLGAVQPGVSVNCTLYLGFGATQDEAFARVNTLRNRDVADLLVEAETYWHSHLQGTTEVQTGNPQWDRLYRRSLLVFGLMADATHGGLIAAPEFDPEWTQCGGYGYCWGRDAAYIATALGQAGLIAQAEHFYHFARLAQEEDGKWDHRHYMNGMLAPSWGFQVDEPASILWGIWQHYVLTQDRTFLETMSESLRKGADFLVTCLDSETGLPRESMDLWEERFAQHTYSAAAVSAALRASAEAAQELGWGSAVYTRWVTVAERIRQTIEEDLWNEERSCFDRGLRLHLKVEEEEMWQQKENVLVEKDEYGYNRPILQRDSVVDVSLLGLSYPFALFASDDVRVEKMANAVRKHLWANPAGGILRYEGDTYIGGNPWILTTLWLGLDALRRGDYEQALEMMQWASAHQTELGLLPEQVDRETGETRWVVPLTWSHAMWVLLVLGLHRAGVFGERGNRSVAGVARQ